MSDTIAAEPDTRAARIQGLRDLADHLDAHPDLPAPGRIHLPSAILRDDELRAAVEAFRPFHLGADSAVTGTGEIYRRFAGVEVHFSIYGMYERQPISSRVRPEWADLARGAVDA